MIFEIFACLSILFSVVDCFVWLSSLIVLKPFGGVFECSRAPEHYIGPIQTVYQLSELHKAFSCCQIAENKSNDRNDSYLVNDTDFQRPILSSLAVAELICYQFAIRKVKNIYRRDFNFLLGNKGPSTLSIPVLTSTIG